MIYPANEGDSGDPPLEFAWPEDHPNLKFEPAIGVLTRGSSVKINATFHSTEAKTYHFSSILCHLFEIPHQESSMTVSSHHC